MAGISAGNLTIGVCHPAYRIAAELSARLPGATVFQEASADAVAPRVPELDVLVISGAWRDDLLDHAVNLKWIQAIGVGYNQFSARRAAAPRHPADQRGRGQRQCRQRTRHGAHSGPEPPPARGAGQPAPQALAPDDQRPPDSRGRNRRQDAGRGGPRRHRKPPRHPCEGVRHACGWNQGQSRHLRRRCRRRSACRPSGVVARRLPITLRCVAPLCRKRQA